MEPYEDYIMIMSDFGEAMFWDKEGAAMGCAFGHCDFQISLELYDEFLKWHDAFECCEYEKPGFDWDEYHRKGIALAKKLKAEVGKDVTVVYEKPFEDPNHEVNGSLIIE